MGVGVIAQRMLWPEATVLLLVLHTGPARLIWERNREREPSREEDRENRREGERRGRERGREEEGRDPAPAHCEHSKCSFHPQQRLRERQREFERANRSSEGQSDSLIGKTVLERNRDQPCWHLFAVASPPASAACCSLRGEYCGAGHLLLFWENRRTPGRCEFLAQLLSTAAPRHKRRNVEQSRGSSFQTLVPNHPSLHPLLPSSSPCIAPALCMGGEALAGCQSACGGVNGQLSAHNTLWTSDTPRCTNERLQARLVRLNREQRLALCVFSSDCVLEM